MKNKHDRRIYISREAEQILFDWVAESDAENFSEAIIGIFNTVDQMAAKIVKGKSLEERDE